MTLSIRTQWGIFLSDTMFGWSVLPTYKVATALARRESARLLSCGAAHKSVHAYGEVVTFSTAGGNDRQQVQGTRYAQDQCCYIQSPIGSSDVGK